MRWLASLTTLQRPWSRLFRRLEAAPPSGSSADRGQGHLGRLLGVVVRAVPPVVSRG